MSQTDIVSESLLCLGDNLTCLGIANTERVNGDLALQYIQSKLYNTTPLTDIVAE